MDPITEFKNHQKGMWAGFALLESFTASVAPRLVSFARPEKGKAWLDVGCGTGVVALTAAREGVRAAGIDLTPELLARAKENASIMNVEGTFQEGDVEALPFADASFDVVVSQFGHMFAPRPEVALREMLRVLRPEGTIAFATWPPEHFVGRGFLLMGKYGPPPPAGVAPPAQWGDPNIVRERLGAAVKDVTFTRGTMWIPALSPSHFLAFMEQNFGPASRLLKGLDASDPTKAANLRREYTALAAEYFEDNRLRQDYLLTRAIKA